MSKVNYEHIGSLQRCMNTYLYRRNTLLVKLWWRKSLSPSLIIPSLSVCVHMCVCIPMSVVHILYACMQVCGYGWSLVSVHLSLCMRTEQMHTYNINTDISCLCVYTCVGGWVGALVSVCACVLHRCMQLLQMPIYKPMRAYRWCMFTIHTLRHPSSWCGTLCSIQTQGSVCHTCGRHS